MKKKHLKATLFIVLLAFQLACGQTQSVLDNNNQNKNVNQMNLTALVNVIQEEKKEINYFAHLKPQHREVLQEWLKDKLYLRPAVEEIDSSLDKSELESIHKKGWTQFYTAADINKDGREDFAVLLVDETKKNKFALAIFNGSLSKGQLPNYFTEDLNGISDSFIRYENESDGYFSSDSYLLLSGKERGCAGFIPKKKVYEAVVCL